MSSQIVRKEDVAHYEGPKLANVILQLIVGSVDPYSSDEELLRLTRGQRALYLISLFDGEVRNGGFRQYFTNSSGDFTAMTLASLAFVGAEEAAGLLREAIGRFPSKYASSDREERNRELEEVAPTDFYDLDKRYYALLKTAGNPWSKVVDALQERPEEFYG